MLALLVAGGATLWWRQPTPPPEVTGTVIAAPAPPGAAALPAATVTIHVGGEVARPGLVSLGEGARVADALAAAGGALRSADLNRINLAAPVRDGEQVIVPAAGAPGADMAQPDAEGSVEGGLPVPVNTASAEALEALPGVGPVLAQRIVEWRDQNGPFTTVEDLLDVPGIGEAKLAAMRDAVAIS